jgi:periplasmic copper chaperone A
MLLCPSDKNGKTVKKIALILASALILAGCSAKPAVEAADLWVKSSEMSMAGGMTAVFGTLTNTTGSDITLTGAATEVAGLVEIHEMAMIDGEMKMQELDGGLVIPAGQSVVLEPGGNHIMLMELSTAIEAGQEISVTLNFDGADSLTLTGIVAKPSEGGDEEYHQHEDGEDHDH